MKKPTRPPNPRLLLTYIPRDSLRIQERRLLGRWNGEFTLCDVQLEMFDDVQI